MYGHIMAPRIVLFTKNLLKRLRNTTMYQNYAKVDASALSGLLEIIMRKM
jgi:hypothetical protein